MNKKTRKAAGMLAAACFTGAFALANATPVLASSATFVTTAAQPKELGPWQTCDVSFINNDERAPAITIEDVPVANVKKQKELGMKAKLTAGSPAMLFTWKHEDYHPVYMKDVNMPLTIAYINKAGRVTELKALTPFDETIKWSNEKVVAAIEMVPPTLSVLGVKVGSQLVLDGCPNLVKGYFEFEQ